MDVNFENSVELSYNINDEPSNFNLNLNHVIDKSSGSIAIKSESKLKNIQTEEICGRNNPNQVNLNLSKNLFKVHSIKKSVEIKPLYNQTSAKQNYSKISKLKLRSNRHNQKGYGTYQKQRGISDKIFRRNDEAQKDSFIHINRDNESSINKSKSYIKQTPFNSNKVSSITMTVNEINKKNNNPDLTILDKSRNKNLDPLSGCSSKSALFNVDKNNHITFIPLKTIDPHVSSQKNISLNKVFIENIYKTHNKGMESISPLNKINKNVKSMNSINKDLVSKFINENFKKLTVSKKSSENIHTKNLNQQKRKTTNLDKKKDSLNYNTNSYNNSISAKSFIIFDKK